MDAVLEPLLMFHRALGYLTVFVIGPVVLLTWRNVGRHRRWGLAYVAAMLALYLTGTPRTFYFQPWPSWELARNVTFNFFGIVQVVIGYRAVRQWKSGEPARRVDHLLMVIFWVNAAAMVAVGLRDLPVFLMGWFALGMACIDLVEVHRSPRDARVHMRRHLRHMFGSYYYLLTVLSIVHLPLGHDQKWIWCGAYGCGVWILGWFSGVRLLPLPRISQTTWTVRGALAANLGLGVFVAAQGAHDLFHIEAETPPTYEQKLAQRWEQFKSAQRQLIEHHLDGRRIDRRCWESFVASPPSYRLTAAEQERLRQDQRRRIELRAAEALRESRFDLDAIRRSPHLRDFCRLLPKGGMLHVHPTGTLHQQTVHSLLERFNPVVGVEGLPNRNAFQPEETAFLRSYSPTARYLDLSRDDRRRFAQLFVMPSGKNDFTRFEAIFALVGRLRGESQHEALAFICDEFLARASSHRVRYVELTTSFAAQREQIELWESMAERARSQFGITLRVNCAFNRAGSEVDNYERLVTLSALLRERPSRIIVGIDLLGAERNHPAFEAGQRLYGKLLADDDREFPWRRTMHAAGLGEPNNVRDAMLLGAQRLGHGTRWPEDPTVLEYAARMHMPVEVNLLSNVRLGYVRDLPNHPFVDLLRLGLRVSLSTDDEGIFETDISNEFAHAVAETDLTYTEVKQLVYHSLETAFLDDMERASLLTELDGDFMNFEDREIPRILKITSVRTAERRNDEHLQKGVQAR